MSDRWGDGPLATVCPVCGDLEFGPHCRAERWKVTRQDVLDGAALRLLREALHENTEMEVTILHGALVWLVAVYNGGDPVVMVAAGTIAEAADKCREALT